MVDVGKAISEGRSVTIRRREFKKPSSTSSSGKKKKVRASSITRSNELGGRTVVTSTGQVTIRDSKGVVVERFNISTQQAGKIVKTGQIENVKAIQEQQKIREAQKIKAGEPVFAEITAGELTSTQKEVPLSFRVKPKVSEDVLRKSEKGVGLEPTFTQIPEATLRELQKSRIKVQDGRTPTVDIKKATTTTPTTQKAIRETAEKTIEAQISKTPEQIKTIQTPKEDKFGSRFEVIGFDVLKPKESAKEVISFLKSEFSAENLKAARQRGVFAVRSFDEVVKPIPIKTSTPFSITKEGFGIDKLSPENLISTSSLFLAAGKAVAQEVFENPLGFVTETAVLSGAGRVLGKGRVVTKEGIKVQTERKIFDDVFVEKGAATGKIEVSSPIGGRKVFDVDALSFLKGGAKADEVVFTGEGGVQLSRSGEVFTGSPIKFGGRATISDEVIDVGTFIKSEFGEAGISSRVLRSEVGGLGVFRGVTSEFKFTKGSFTPERVGVGASEEIFRELGKPTIQRFIGGEISGTGSDIIKTAGETFVIKPIPLKGFIPPSGFVGGASLISKKVVSQIPSLSESTIITQVEKAAIKFGSSKPLIVSPKPVSRTVTSTGLIEVVETPRKVTELTRVTPVVGFKSLSITRTDSLSKVGSSNVLRSDGVTRTSNLIKSDTLSKLQVTPLTRVTPITSISTLSLTKTKPLTGSTLVLVPRIRPPTTLLTLDLPIYKPFKPVSSVDRVRGAFTVLVREKGVFKPIAKGLTRESAIGLGAKEPKEA